MTPEPNALDVIKRIALFLALVTTVATPLSAQRAATTSHSVRGVVFDSVSGVPLVGAKVQIASLDLSSPVFNATTDATGHFRFDDLPSGRFMIGFYHDALTVFGLDAPLRPLELDTAPVVTVDVGVPSGAAIHALRCGVARGTTPTGMLAGLVRDAAQDAPVDGAKVTVEWRAVALDSGNVRMVTQSSETITAADGTYRMCALPADAPLTLRLLAADYRPVAGPVQVPMAGVRRQDLRLAESRVERGGATVAGIVRRESGKPVTSGRVAISALGRDEPFANGRFVIAGIPAGTWLVEFKSVGVEPVSSLVEGTENRSDGKSITMPDQPQSLDAVTVVGATSRDSRVFAELLYQKRYGAATVFLAGSDFLATADRVRDVLRAARGFSPKGDGGYYGRFTPKPVCYLDDNEKKKCSARCDVIRVYLNGERVPEGLAGIDNRVTVREVLGVEAYPDIAFARPEWRYPEGDNACAVVAIWTKAGS